MAPREQTTSFSPRSIQQQRQTADRVERGWRERGESVRNRFGLLPPAGRERPHFVERPDRVAVPHEEELSHELISAIGDRRSVIGGRLRATMSDKRSG